MLKKKLTASLIQFDCPARKDRALKIIEAQIEKAAEAGPDLILLGETAYTPYTTAKEFDRCAEEIPGPYSSLLKRLAKQHGIYLCSGMVESFRGRTYNTAILVSPKGKIIYKYRKVNIRGEAKWGISKGGKIAVVETEFGKVGILICSDTSSLEVVSAQAALEPDLVLVPSYGLATHDYRAKVVIDCMVDECIEEWRVRMQTVAKCCKAYVLRADHCGTEKKQVRVGHSVAVSPGGYVMAEATMKPAILTVELDPDAVSQKSW